MQYNLLSLLYSKELITEEVYPKIPKGLLDDIWPSKKFENNGFEVNVGGEMSISNAKGLKINYKKDNLVSSYEMNIIKLIHKLPIFRKDDNIIVKMEYITTVQINADNGYYVIVACYSDYSSEAFIRELYYDDEAITYYRQNVKSPSDTPLPDELENVGLEPDVNLSARCAKSYLTDIFRNSIFMDGRDLIRNVEAEILANKEMNPTPLKK